MHNSFDEKGIAVLTEMRNYLLEHGLQNCANAFDKAIGEVISFETDGIYHNYYSKKVNRYLCEALLHVNMDTHCNNIHRTLMRGLIENYRKIYGLSTADFGFEYNI